MHDHTTDPSYDASVVIDIGDDIGALVLHTTADWCGVEIDIEPIVPPGPRSHVAVRERRLPHATRYAAVYPSLRAGRYVLHPPAEGPPCPVTIEGGAVTELTWS